MHTLIQESKQSGNPLSMLIACSFSSKGVYRPLNGTEQLTKDSQHGPAPTLSISLSLYFLLGQAVAHPHNEFLKKCATVILKQLFILQY